MNCHRVQIVKKKNLLFKLTSGNETYKLAGELISKIFSNSVEADANEEVLIFEMKTKGNHYHFKINKVYQF